jgi:hypothetical protein
MLNQKKRNLKNMPNGIFSGIKGNKADMQPGLLRLSS